MTHGLPATWDLLAAWRTNWVDKFDGVYWDSNTDEVWAIFVATAALLVGVLVWHVATSWLKGRFPTSSLAGLFRELCRAHRLSHSDRRVLKGLAVARGVASPALLFVQPEHFDVGTLPPELSGHADDVARLAECLFADHPASE